MGVEVKRMISFPKLVDGKVDSHNKIRRRNPINALGLLFFVRLHGTHFLESIDLTKNLIHKLRKTTIGMYF
jgi:hypothetical protein